jgi:hypothetical protein
MALSKIDTTNMIEDVPQSKIDNNINFRNIIINGGMDIAQRSTSATASDASYNTCDRWRTTQQSLGVFTQSQSTTVPTGQGFSSSLKMDCTTADASPAVSDRLLVEQRFEGQNLQYLKKGTSSAESLTCSFWVRSNKTGTYIVNLYDAINDRAISKSYTISSADTWEKKTITFAGDTTGAFNNDNANNLNIRFYLGAGTNFTSGTLQTSWGSNSNANTAVGQVNLADSTSNEWYITGVQLEAGTTASDFEFLPYDVNLRRCERYYENSFPLGNYPSSYTGNNAYHTTAFPDGNAPGTYFRTHKRASATITLRPQNTTTTGQVGSAGTNRSASAINTNSKQVSYISITSGTGNGYVRYNYEADAEL